MISTVSWCFTALSAQNIGYYHAIEVGNVSHRAGENTIALKQRKNTINQHNRYTKADWDSLGKI